ncbi:MAG: chorismate-binding protein, partial [Pseudomonadota bacterium]
MPAWSFGQLTDAFSAVSGPDDLRRLNQAFPDRYPFLLQSTSRGSELGRYDILFAFPGESLVLDNANPEEPFLAALDDWWQRDRQDLPDSPLPFRGGWFLYLGYELAGEIEPKLDMHTDPLLPIAFAVRCKTALIWDHEQQVCVLVEEPVTSSDVAQMCADVDALESEVRAEVDCSAAAVEETPTNFTDAVIVAKQHIAAGDVYQANLSREWRATIPSALCSEAIYETLCATNPAPFAGIARWRDTTI